MRARIAALLVGAILTAGVAAGAAADAETAPRRVVSMNVCTDQLAMLVAAPGQLHSVSHLAGEAGSSALAAEAAAYRFNHGFAEEIFLMRPDLVIAGTSTTRTTVSMLRRLGFPVEEFAPETSFDDVRANIRRMGAILKREGRADELIAALNRGLDELTRNAPSGRTVATYSANSYTAGRGSLTAAVIAAAGLENLGTRLGIAGSGRLPLELLVLAQPDIVAAESRPGDTPALAQQNFVHPAYRAAAEVAESAVVPEAYWICGGPFTLLAAGILQDAARRLPASRE